MDYSRFDPVNPEYPRQLAPSALVGPSAFGSGAPVLVGIQSGVQLLLRAGNTDVQVSGVCPRTLEILDRYLSYPTEQALAQSDGWRPPESVTGDWYWDGWVRLARIGPDGRGTIPTGLLDLTLWVLDQHQIPYHLEDERIRPLEGIPDLYEPVVDRDYQLEAVEAAVSAGRGVLDLPPRAGKTRILIEVHRRLALPTIWICPTRNIVAQTQDAISGFFGPHHVQTVRGSKIHEDVGQTRVVLATAATARNLPDWFWATREMLVIDEFHHAAARTFSEISASCPHIYHRYGMTGTFFRSGSDALAMHAILSRTVYRVTPSRLADLGHLVRARAVFLPVPGDRIRVPSGGNFASGPGRHGLYEHGPRNDLVAHVAERLEASGRRVLILVATKAQGREILSRLRTRYPAPSTGHHPVEFVSTDRSSDAVQGVLEAFLAGHVRILLGTSMIGEGTDLPAADALVYAAGGKAEVSLVQAVFRVCTASEGKPDRALVVDFADRCHRTLLDHSLARARVYWDLEIFDVEFADDADEFLDSVGESTGASSVVLGDLTTEDR